jgi:hypothetical protein
MFVRELDHKILLDTSFGYSVAENKPVVITEVFPNPTVKQVVFQVKFPNLFYLENKIGDFQMKIMKDYPKSELQYRRSAFLLI